MTILDPCDAVDIAAVPVMAEHPGPVYSRLLRGKVPGREPPQARLQIQDRQGADDPRGRDVLVISSGFMTMRALDAPRGWPRTGFDVAVLHWPTIKPLDTETIVAEAGRAGRLVVTAENHTVVGGLGEAVAAGCCSRASRRLSG